MPSISRSSLPGAGAPKITFNGVTLWTRGDVVIPLTQALREQVSSMYGRVAKTREGRKIEFGLPLYGFWTNLATLFPSYFLNFVASARIFGAADLPLVAHARNGDKLTIANARLTGISNLKLGANQQVFSADAKFTALIKNGGDPTDADAFFTWAANQAYAEGDFPQASFKSRTWTGAWGARSGFTSILTQEGWDINWEIRTSDDLVDGVGPVDQFSDLCWLTASCIPVGPTGAQLTAGVDFQGGNAAVGAAVGDDVDNLILTDGTSTLTIYNAALVKTEAVFAPAKKRFGQTMWEVGKRDFAAGAPTAIAAVA